LAVIDEAQSIKSQTLATLIDDILEPASLDLDGSIWMFGTPAASVLQDFSMMQTS
jgi:hypothetical protein